MSAWDPQLYQASHRFVWQYAQDLVGMLAPRPGERILDLGCGTGQLTAAIAKAGAEVLGIDNSAGMIAAARANFPALQFELADAARLPYRAEFDAVFSNAALHWVRDADAAAAGMARALKPGGRLVLEFGGRGNCRRLLEATYHALAAMGVAHPQRLMPWYFPSIGEYATLLESRGLAVTSAALFPRSTPLPGRFAEWFTMFGQCFLDAVPPAGREELIRRIEDNAAPHLLENGIWHADYRRLRVTAGSLADTERGENAVEDVVGRGGAGNRIDRP